jgi:hypothetical protein
MAFDLNALRSLAKSASFPFFTLRSIIILTDIAVHLLRVLSPNFLTEQARPSALLKNFSP